MAKFELQLDTENVAAWMTINNSFCFPDEDPGNSEYWNGVLVQPGRYHNHEQDNLIESLARIEIVVDDVPAAEVKKTDLEGGGLVWINVVRNRKNGGKKEPMTEEHAPALFPSDANGLWTLHRFLKPYNGGITMWSYPGYDLEAKPNQIRRDRHSTSTFSFEFDPQVEACRIDVWERQVDGSFKLREPSHDVKNKARITLVDVGGGPGGTTKNPPQDPPPG